jgi:hypothetical protein
MGQRLQQRTTSTTPGHMAAIPLPLVVAVGVRYKHTPGTIPHVNASQNFELIV